MRNAHLAAPSRAAAPLTGPTLVAAQAPPTPTRSDLMGLHVAGCVNGAGMVDWGRSDRPEESKVLAVRVL